MLVLCLFSKGMKIALEGLATRSGDTRRIASLCDPSQPAAMLPLALCLLLLAGCSASMQGTGWRRLVAGNGPGDTLFTFTAPADVHRDWRGSPIDSDAGDFIGRGLRLDFGDQGGCDEHRNRTLRLKDGQVAYLRIVRWMDGPADTLPLKGCLRAPHGVTVSFGCATKSVLHRTLIMLRTIEVAAPRRRNSRIRFSSP